MLFERLWPMLAIPGEYDAMDETDQGRWRNVIRQAFEAGRREEREACAKVCDGISAPLGHQFLAARPP